MLHGLEERLGIAMFAPEPKIRTLPIHDPQPAFRELRQLLRFGPVAIAEDEIDRPGRRFQPFAFKV